jgi:hypothetical protein
MLGDGDVADNVTSRKRAAVVDILIENHDIDVFPFFAEGEKTIIGFVSTVVIATARITDDCRGWMMFCFLHHGEELFAAGLAGD